MTPITPLLEILSRWHIKCLTTVLTKYSTAQTSKFYHDTMGSEDGLLQTHAGVIFRGIRGK